MLERHVDWITRNALIDELMGFGLGHIREPILRMVMEILKEGHINHLCEMPQEKLLTNWQLCLKAVAVLETMQQLGMVPPHHMLLVERFCALSDRTFRHFEHSYA